MWPPQKNYLRTALCQLTVQRAHKQDHLAIISSQSQIHSKANVYREKWATVGEEENRTGGERGQERGMEERGGGGGGLLEPGRGHGVPVERNSRKHP